VNTLAKVTDVSDPANPLAARPGESAVTCVVMDHYTPAVNDWVVVSVENGTWLILGKVTT
jgi:hypothetical protein